jgi:predicted ABC-type ATPase
LRAESANLAAGRLFLHELDRLAKTRVSFAFESTLSGLTYVKCLKRRESIDYRVEIIFYAFPLCGSRFAEHLSA